MGEFSPLDSLFVNKRVKLCSDIAERYILDMFEGNSKEISSIARENLYFFSGLNLDS
jgi:hydroxyethylthiazole kinase-like sugar kinase family protein